MCTLDPVIHTGNNLFRGLPFIFNQNMSLWCKFDEFLSAGPRTFICPRSAEVFVWFLLGSHWFSMWIVHDAGKFCTKVFCKLKYACRKIESFLWVIPDFNGISSIVDSKNYKEMSLNGHMLFEQVQQFKFWLKCVLVNFDLQGPEETPKGNVLELFFPPFSSIHGTGTKIIVVFASEFFHSS